MNERKIREILCVSCTLFILTHDRLKGEIRGKHTTCRVVILNKGGSWWTNWNSFLYTIHGNIALLIQGGWKRKTRAVYNTHIGSALKTYWPSKSHPWFRKCSCPPSRQGTWRLPTRTESETYQTFPLLSLSHHRWSLWIHYTDARNHLIITVVL